MVQRVLIVSILIRRKCIRPASPESAAGCRERTVTVEKAVGARSKVRTIGSGECSPPVHKTHAVGLRRQRTGLSRSRNLPDRSTAAKIHKVCKVNHAVQVREQKPLGREARVVVSGPNVIQIGSKFDDVIPLDPGYRVPTFQSAFVNGIVGSEVVSELQIVRYAQVGFAGSPREVVVPPGIL